jgi:serine/threonine-protein kinase/endoribonuclease IRE1
MLLATVDGNLHARERRSGAPRWTLEVDREMVETIRHPHNKTFDEHGVEIVDPMFIIEPSQDGAIYALGPMLGLQKLPYTVKQLSELAPFAQEGDPAVTYTAEKKNTLYTVDAATGNILKSFSSAGSFVNEDRSCRRVHPLDTPLDALDERECEPIGTLTLGRTEYTIGIQNRDTGEPISTIKYFEWGPNNRDNDLRSRYTDTKDNRYVYSNWNGRVHSIPLKKGTAERDPTQHTFTHTFSSPVVRVFDIVRPNTDPSGDASLVILPQPVPPSSQAFAALEDVDPVYINHTKAGNWYALSEQNYPSVTDMAKEVNYQDFAKQWSRMEVAGVYNLPHEDLPSELAIAGGHQLTIDGSPPVRAVPMPVQNAGVETIAPMAKKPGVVSEWASMFVIAVLCAVVGAGSLGVAAWFRNPEVVKSIMKSTPITVDVKMADAINMRPGEEPMSSSTFIREHEPAEETIFPRQEGEQSPTKVVHFVETVPEDENPAKNLVEEVDVEDDSKNDSPLENNAPEPEPKPKKKATRGRRGGRKQKEKEQSQAEARAKKNESAMPTAEKVITRAESETQQLSGPLQINSLVIHTDKVIGQGSCGTIVFEGSFEGRDVAVKRMLSQYYELASQEVSFLQQSDDHANVVRYFCQQKDDHFLYIAVELCQASLFEVWEAERAKTEERRQQLAVLKLAIQQDMTRTLQQLAAGLCHLHKLRIIHRDIKPQNVLVAFPKRTQPPGSTRLVISDFGLGKNLPENQSTLVDPTGNAGTSGWKAPELISVPRETDSNHSRGTSNGSESGTPGVSGVKRAADIFSLGCLFFWVLTDGVHPFEDENGWQQLRELNIKRDKRNMEALERWSDSYEPMQLISSMLAYQPENRPTAQAVLNHPYFWSPEKRLAFLCDCSDHFEREPRGTWEDGYREDSDHLCLLESRAEEVIGPRGDFLTQLDRMFVDTLGKQRKYSGNRLLDLLRALRNKKNHYEDMPDEVKKRVGPLAGGYLSYWSNRFPRLLMACYEVIHQAGLQDNDRFKGYFGLGADS